MFKKLILCFIMSVAFLHTQSSVVLLHGIGSVGKSLISNSLQNLFEKDTAFIALEDMMWPVLMQEAHGRGLIDDCMNIEQKYQIITEHKDEVFAKFMDVNWLPQKQLLYDQVKLLTQTYHNVVFATVFGFNGNFDTIFDFWQTMHDVNVFSVLVYCLPSKLAQFVIQRNKLPSYAEKRDLISTLKQFALLYRSADSDYVVDVLTKQEIEKMLIIVQTHLLETGIVENLVQEKITQLRELYYKTFFEDADEVAIAPRFAHDMMVNTGELSAEQCAQLIYNTFMKS